MSLIRKIKDYYNNGKSILFTTPSHSQGSFICEEAKELLGEQFFKCDFSEIEGFDNLRNPTGILAELQTKISKIYRSKTSFLLTNGSSSGIHTLMMSILKENDKVLAARNCHVSVYNALVLTGAQPVWFLPEYDSQWNIYKGVQAKDIDEKLKKDKDIKAVFITSPTYEGLFSNIEEIAEVTKKHNVILIVDEAHGALTNFGDFKAKPAILCGADASVQSLHKTAGAPNPCALLHLSELSKIDAQKVQESLNLLNTTSPSYPLLAAAEAAINFLASDNGKNYIEDLISNINNLKKDCSDDLIFYEGYNDPTKIVLRFKHGSALSAAEILNHRFNIEEEFSTDSYMLFITGIGTRFNKLKKLFTVLKHIKPLEFKRVEKKFLYRIPEKKLNPRECFFMDKEYADKDKACGKICAETIITYPPGIPLLLPGELIKKEYLEYINQERVKIIL